MLNMPLIHPQFDPVALHITDSFGIHWYGLMYLLGFIAFLVLGKYQIKHKAWFGWNTQMLDDALFYGALGVILGGRIGFVLFYQFGNFLQNPLDIFKVWQGGMSFHGGFLGVLVAMFLFNRKYPQPWLKVMDFVAPLVPIGLAAGRLANFINGELWGRPVQRCIDLAVVQKSNSNTQASSFFNEFATFGEAWDKVGNSCYGMIFPQVDQIARHPSQLYQFALEGLLLFAILWWFSIKQRPVGAISGLFLIGYGSFRFVAEYTREPDAYLGLLSLGFSMGQWLSLPMIVIGIWMFFKSKNHYFGK
jgi:phosphatidylglycerol---prolipoprotein diacylglyceryl transferase